MNDDGGGSESLTGVWEGLYSYPGNLDPPNGFTATLLQSGDSVTGTVHEIGEMGVDQGRRIHAFVDGRRMGARVAFTKIYDVGPESDYSAPVVYEGSVSGDGQEIEGRWTIQGVWSGKFLMVRPGRTVAATRQAALAKV